MTSYLHRWLSQAIYLASYCLYLADPTAIYITSMSSEQAEWNWSKECQKAFDTIKMLVSRETLLFYPKLTSQDDKPNAFYSS